MMHNQFFKKLTGMIMIMALLFSLASCISVDHSAANTTQNLQTEYRHIKNTIHNYENSNGWNNGNDSSDYDTPDDEIVAPDNNQANNGDNDETIVPEINYDDEYVAPDTPIFSDNFENHGNSGDFIPEYEMIGGSDPCEGYVSSDAMEGNYSGMFSHSIASSQWSGVVYTFNKESNGGYDFQNWKNQKYLSFWAKANDAMAFMVGMSDGMNSSFFRFDAPAEWTFYCVKIDSFLEKGFNLQNIKSVMLSWSGGTASAWIDDIRITEYEIKQYPNYIPEGDIIGAIENGESYDGDTKGVQAAYALIEGEEYATTAESLLDGSEKKNGGYSVKFNVKAEAGKQSVAFTAKLAKTVSATLLNNIVLSIKGTSVGKVVNAAIYLDDVKIADADCILSDEWKEFLIPFAPQDGKTSLLFNRIVLSTSLLETDTAFWVDDFAIVTRDGVPDLPADVIETAEFYTDAYSVTDAYKPATNHSYQATVSLDGSVKRSGNKSVKFSLPGQTGVTEPGIFANDTSGTVPAWGTQGWSKQVHFDTPMDLSSPEGYVKVVASLNNTSAKLYYSLNIITKNKTSSKIGGQGYLDTYNVDTTVPLKNTGLTADDLKEVTGYSVEFWGNCSANTIATYTFSIPQAPNETCETTYLFPTKDIEPGQHFKLSLRGDTVAQKQAVIIEILNISGKVCGTLDTEFDTDATFKDLYIPNNSVGELTINTVRIIFPLSEKNREIWLDDFVTFVPIEPTVDDPNVIDEYEHYNAFFPIQSYFTFEKSAGYGTNMTAIQANAKTSNAKVRNGEYSLKLNCPDFPQGKVYYSMGYQDMSNRNIVINKGDNISVWVAKTENSQSGIRISIVTTAGTLDSLYDSNKSGEFVATDSDWHELTFNTAKLTSNSATIKQIQYFIGDYNDGVTSFCVDDFVITRK